MPSYASCGLSALQNYSALYHKSASWPTWNGISSSPVCPNDWRVTTELFKTSHVNSCCALGRNIYQELFGQRARVCKSRDRRQNWHPTIERSTGYGGQAWDLGWHGVTTGAVNSFYGAQHYLLIHSAGDLLRNTLIYSNFSMSILRRVIELHGILYNYSRSYL